MLERFARHEAALEAGPYLPYKEVLAGCLRALGEELGFAPTDEQARVFGTSVTDWPAFDDSPAALQQLKQRFKLAVITNCDDDLFAASNRRLGVEFDWIVTAEQARGYKPRTENFDVSPSSASTSRASGSCTSPRACSTTTCRRRRWG